MTADQLLQFLSGAAILGLLQLTVGKYLKSIPAIPNKVIPWVTLLLSILGYSIAPVPAAAAGFAPLAPALGVGVLAIFQTFLVTGVHSFSKNAIGPILTTGLRAAAQALLAKGDK